VETGTHAQLLALDGIYAQLCKSQALLPGEPGVSLPLGGACQTEGISPHPVPLPMGEGTLL
jgi:hypothetical protein